jgi:catabolite regulation protein CreA
MWQLRRLVLCILVFYAHAQKIGAFHASKYPCDRTVMVFKTMKITSLFDVMPSSLVVTKVSDELAASIFKVKEALIP